MGNETWRPPRRAPGGRVSLGSVAAVLFAALLLLSGAHIPAKGSYHTVDALGFVLLALAGGAVLVCGRWPRIAVAVTIVVVATYAARHYVNGPIYASAWIVLLVLSYRTDRRTSLIAAALMCAVLTAAAFAGAHGLAVLPLVFVGWSAAAAFLGEALRNRRTYIAERQARAREVARSHEDESRRRLAEERLRIARDLHDSVAHAMATISVQSGAAQHVLEHRPDAARTALAAIREASAGVLDELAVILRLLRDEEDPGRAPTPDLSHVEQLVATSRDAGLQITLSVKGPTADVPAAISTAAYRIVQESLTNVLKHASSPGARVTIAAQPGGGLLLEIGDDGTGGDASGSTGGGVGIQGMRERAQSSGGSFRAGPVATGGFTVRAEWAAR